MAPRAAAESGSPEVRPDLVIAEVLPPRPRSGRFQPVKVTAPGFVQPTAASRGVTMVVCQLVGARDEP
jgi:hypothetical protein